MATLSDDDVAGRRKSIGDYEKALEQYRAARSMRSSQGVEGKITEVEGVFTGLEDAMGTIAANRDADAENKRIEEEEARQRAIREAFEKTRGGSGGDRP